jgi:hypothetical protein
MHLVGFLGSPHGGLGVPKEMPTHSYVLMYISETPYPDLERFLKM